ncbi:hypothetical protein DFP72DRAFT_844779 [Ephemerocybe angulata]|uniref:Uncharacterized protein n=1 Tax=Ephemerocybe angulata TaxID=980116 RepID=A0A8H6I589_9AGAR|nr:hypothetical protein DFP72DRAFT_844779 [Tulosesus angulatus]
MYRTNVTQSRLTKLSCTTPFSWAGVQRLSPHDADVDEAIDRCSEVYNLRDSIEEACERAYGTTDEKQKRAHVLMVSHQTTGMHDLRRYFELIVFQAYLQSTEPDTMRSFPTVDNFVKERPVIKTFEKRLIDHGLDALNPLEHVETQEGAADPLEVTQIVKNRNRTIVFASTILKSDFFSDCKSTFLVFTGGARDGICFFSSGYIQADYFSSGMKVMQLHISASQLLLERVDAGPNGTNTILWTSLRKSHWCNKRTEEGHGRILLHDKARNDQGGKATDYFPPQSSTTSSRLCTCSYRDSWLWMALEMCGGIRNPDTEAAWSRRAKPEVYLEDRSSRVLQASALSLANSTTAQTTWTVAKVHFGQFGQWRTTFGQFGLSRIIERVS